MTWKQVSNSDAGDADHFGGNDGDKISQAFSGSDVDDFDMACDFKFRSGKLQLANPANTFKYTITPGAISADRTLNIPVITATDTLSVLGLAQTYTAAKTFNSSTLKLRNPADTFSYTIVPAAIAADRSLNLPLTTATDTLVALGVANDYGDFDNSFKDNRLRIWNPADTFRYTITGAAIAADRQLNLPLTTGTDTLASLGLAQTFTANNVFSGTTTINTAKIGANARVLPVDTDLTAERTFTFPNISDRITTRNNSISNPYDGAGSSASVRRQGLWVGVGDTNTEGILSTGCTAIVTGGTVTDTTEGFGRSFATAASANANAGLRWSAARFRREWGSYMICRVGFSSTSDIRVFIGFSSDVNEIAGETTLDNFSGVGVGKAAADTNWFTYRNDGDATQDKVDTTIAFATTVITIEVELDSTSFRSKINGTTQTAQTSEIPSASTNLAPHVQIETGAGAAAKTITIYPIWTKLGPEVMIP